MTDPGTGRRGEDVELPAFASPADFAPCIRWAVGHALSTRARRLVWVDRDFGTWPLDDASLLSSLGAWVRLPQRRLVLVASDFGSMARRHPRFTDWRRTWAHAVEAWSPGDDTEFSLPTLLVDDQRLCFQVHDLDRGRGSLSLDDTTARHWSEEIDALLQRCEAAYPAYQLGL